MPIRRPGKAPQTGIRNGDNGFASGQRNRLNRDLVVFAVIFHVGESATVRRPGEVSDAIPSRGGENLCGIAAVRRHQPNATAIQEGDVRSVGRGHGSERVVSEPDQLAGGQRETPKSQGIIRSGSSADQKFGSVPEPCQVGSTEAQALGHRQRVRLAGFDRP